MLCIGYMPTIHAGTPLTNEPIQPIPLTVDVDSAKATLGRELFFDTALSADGDISCASCHNLKEGGADTGKRYSIGHNGSEGGINSPTVYNSSLLFRQFWDGRAETLEDQADQPVTNPVEMAARWPDVLARLYENPSYPNKFQQIYSDGITRENVKNAIAEFERTLLATNSPFDQYLRGNENALTAKEKKGYELFKNYGCHSCHQGVNVGGNMFQVFGAINNYFEERGNITKADLGRFNVTGDSADKFVFKVPSLRMAKYTAPYFHDGTQKTLLDAVNAMFRYQLGREAPDSDKEAIIAFIESLAGEHLEMKK